LAEIRLEDVDPAAQPSGPDEVRKERELYRNRAGMRNTRDVATFLGQALGWYRPGEGAGLIGAVVGAIIVLLVYGMITNRRTA
jgi:hypothetical protein